MKVEGLRVLVTAAAGGAGRVIAELFAEAGARVHVCDIDATAVDELRSARSAIGASCVDLADPQAIEDLVKEVHAGLGGLDVLVNNVGIAGPTKPAEEISVDDWDVTMNVNVRSHFLCARGVIPGMKAQC